MPTNGNTEKVDSETLEDQGANGNSADVDSKTKDVSIVYPGLIWVLSGCVAYFKLLSFRRLSEAKLHSLSEMKMLGPSAIHLFIAYCIPY